MDATINVGVSSQQGLLDETVTVIEHQPLFSQIVPSDGYRIWISTDQLSFLPQESHSTSMVTGRGPVIFR